MKMKRKLLFSFIFITSIGSILVSTSCRTETNNEAPVYPEPPVVSPNDPNKPITPPTEPEKPPVTPPTEPEKPPVDPNPIDPEIQKIYFTNQADLENKLNELYRNNLKKDLLEIAKKDFEQSFPGSTITLPESISLSDVRFEQTVEQNTYILKAFNDLTVTITLADLSSFSVKSHFQDYKLNIYFIKQ